MLCLSGNKGHSLFHSLTYSPIDLFSHFKLSKLSHLRRHFFILICSLSLFACRQREKAPDVSNIQVSLKTLRFDQDFFAIDTNNIDAGLTAVRQKYPQLLPLFLQRFLEAENNDQVKEYYRYYRSLFDSSQKLYKDFSGINDKIAGYFRYVKYYFPAYQLPDTLFTVLGPLGSAQDLAAVGNGDYSGCFLGPGWGGVSLQFYLGANFSFYQEPMFANAVAPVFRSRRFAPEYIPADFMKLIVDDLFPDRSTGRPLLEQMVEKGKQWWLLDKFMPGAPDSVKTGYTAKQLDWCESNEGMIWSTINRSHQDLYSNSPAVLQLYIGEAPFTQTLSQEDSPGNIGPWIGWQIIKKYMENNKDVKPEQLMKTDAVEIINGSKYKPR